MTEIHIVWHKNPDTDATLSAIVFADYLHKKWYSATPYIQWELNKETEYLLQTLHIQKPEIKTSFPEWTKIALVDHNEKSQTVDNIWELEICWVVDHHKVDFSTKFPVNIRMENICSTCSIIYKMYKEAWFEISKEIWTLILAWILSDSLLFRSATTTKEDRVIADELKNITAITDFEQFAMPMFNAKSDLWDMNPDDIVKYDYKEFEVNGYKIWVWTLETTNPSYALGRKEELLFSMGKIKKESHLDFILLSVVDIIWMKNISLVWDESDANIVNQIFHTEVKDHLADLQARLSRKKQIIPDLMDFFNL